jgi:cobalt/nickel transport system permease protein
MAHIPDAVLSAPVLIGGAILAAGFAAVSLSRLDATRIPQAAVLSAVFFVASLVHIPVGAASVHPLLNGLMGVVLGTAAVPAILVGLTLQAVFFGFGGLTSLGINVCTMAIPALLAGVVLRAPLRHSRGARRTFCLGAIAGSGGVALTAVLVGAALALSGPEYVPALGLVLISYGPLAVVEAALTGAAAVLLQQVRPDILGLARR